MSREVEMDNHFICSYSQGGFWLTLLLGHCLLVGTAGGQLLPTKTPSIVLEQLTRQAVAS